MNPTATRRPQRLEALQRANAHRVDRGAFKRRLRADGPLYAPLRVAHVLAAPGDVPGYLASMFVVDLLRAIPRFEVARAHRLLSAAAVSPRRTVGTLTFRERQALADALDRVPLRRANAHSEPIDRLTRAERQAFEQQLRAGC